MNNEQRARTSLRFIAGMVIVSLMTVPGCGGKHTAGEKAGGEADSAAVGDSTRQLAEAQPVDNTSYEERQGAVLFHTYCAVCHGPQGGGDGFNAYNLDPRPRDLSDSTYMSALSGDQIVQTISGGGRSVNKSPLMPAYGWTLNKQNIRSLTAYVKMIAHKDR